MFGLPLGLIIRVGLALIVVAIVTYSVHLYNDSIRNTLRVKYEAELNVANQRTDDAIAINDTLRKSLAETERKVADANAAVAEFQRISEQAGKDASEAIAKAQQNARASRVATDALIAKAKGPPTAGTQAAIWAEADRILTEYASDIQKAREVLGIK